MLVRLQGQDEYLGILRGRNKYAMHRFFYVRRLVNHPFNRCPLKDSRSRSVLIREACLSKRTYTSVIRADEIYPLRIDLLMVGGS